MTQIEDTEMTSRFIKGVTTAAAQRDVKLPWTRGATRKAFVAKRTAPLPDRKSA